MRADPDEMRITRFERQGQERRAGDHATHAWRQSTDKRLDALEAEVSANRTDTAEIRQILEAAREFFLFGAKAASLLRRVARFMLPFVAILGAVLYAINQWRARL